MKGTKQTFIIPAAILLIILSAYTSKAQKTIQVKQVGKQAYIETSNDSIAGLAIKQLGIKRYSKDKQGVLRLSFKRVDSNIVFNWITSLNALNIDQRRK